VTASVRPARREDHAAVAEFTAQTFTWGDYVPHAFLDWLDDEDSAVFVATDVDDVAIAVARVVQLSPRESWAHAARVHPDHRRRGLGLALNRAGLAWSRERGMRVNRLMTERWNEAARKQVAKAGYREVAEWFHAGRALEEDVDDGGPTPQTLQPATPHDVESSFMAWSRSDLPNHAHSLLPVGWHMRSIRIDDIASEAAARRLWEAPAGWAVIQPTEEDPPTVWIPWMVTIADDAYAFVRAIVARMHSAGIRNVEALLPSAPWMMSAFEHARFDIHPNIVWEFPIS
jgi:ribosomal protein S18 acetylase RimI-like enzyme